MKITNVHAFLPFINKETPRVPSFSRAGKNEQKTDTFEMSVGYVNDLHGQTNNMMRILSGIRGDIILSAGDNDIGDEKNRHIHDATAKFLNLAQVKATALGNHEMDTMQGDLKKTADMFNGHILAVNIKQKPLKNQQKEEIESYNKSDINEFIKKSVITDVNGEKVGIIGTTPIDLMERCTHPDYHRDCEVHNMDKTLKLIQKEAEELQKQGVNKVILVSHLGHERDREVAQNTKGIDIIISGHTHELLEGVEEGKNLLFSKSGEPVIIAEAGKDGKHFGELKVTFDKDGVITKVQNNLGNVSHYYKNLVHQYIFSGILEKPEYIGIIEKSPLPPKTLIEENPHANFMCDAMKYEMDADIALWNNGGPRNYFRAGDIDSSDINEIAPFKDNISVAEVSEKTLVEAFKKAVEKSYNSHGNKPGLLAVSGLNYTVSPSKKALVEMNFVDREGKEHKIDINNPRENKFYKVVADSFVMSWGVDYDILAPKEKCEEYPFNKAYLTCEYIKHLNKPIVINQTGRIIYAD